ncbi:NPC1-like intracellular cholesterol transporter 1 [Protopterus annectens]|uniref:NPC1-like intracellular cholesterol transporter 1 n=1 Tax=Protopterus annectens TaxID=7888 RepID=UPI001CFBFA91|nr:NPC1-like intracellular cholesterol transporter 1 [Protopterus annectens]
MLYSLFTYDCVAFQHDTSIVKSAGNTTVIGLISNGDESEYRREVEKLLKWCQNMQVFLLNAAKKEEMGPKKSDTSRKNKWLSIEKKKEIIDKIERGGPLFFDSSLGIFYIHQSYQQLEQIDLDLMPHPKDNTVTGEWIHREGYCSMYEECGKNPTVDSSLLPAIVPCVRNEPAPTISGLHLTQLKNLCPMFDIENGTARACCSLQQLNTLQISLSLSKPILSRCPSCLDNFVNIYCQNICSPDQSLHINITKTFSANVSGDIKDAVLEFEAFYGKKFAEESFDSCKNVRLPATGGYAIEAMCGKYGSSFCTAQRWLDFQGDVSNGLAPLKIDYRLIDSNTSFSNGINPYNRPAWKCNEPSSSDGEACSCQDCVQSCPVISPPPSPQPPFQIGNVDGVLVICILIFCLFFTVALSVRIYWCFSKHQPKKKKLQQELTEKDVTWSDRASLATQQFLGRIFQKWGVMVSSYPITVILITSVIVIVLSVGMVFISLTTDPVELWSAPNSRARIEKDFHDANFNPFFRTNQLILTVKNRSGYTYDSPFFGSQNFSGLITKDILLELLDLQTKIYNIVVWSEKYQMNVTLKDVCYAPLNPRNPNTTDCCVNSLMQYFQNNKTLFDMTAPQGDSVVDWRDHFIYCVNSPLSFKDNTKLGLSCMADYGAPVFPFLAVGGYEDEKYTEAEALILTFSLNNFLRNTNEYEYALLWEKQFLEVVKAYQQDPSSNFTIAYMAERSLEDEINRTTLEDIPIFAISYLVIFVYIALTLGKYSSCGRLLIDSKLTLALGGIMVVLWSVLAAMGFYAYIGVPSSLIILEVVPFLVLAVGADNIFIFVLELQKDDRKPNETHEQQIGRVLSTVAPSMLLCSISESVCFFLGALTKMPAVKSFALYAALAVIFDFLLQMSAFVALVSLDTRRQENLRLDLCCCAKKKSSKKPPKTDGFLLSIMRDYYAPFLLHGITRFIVIILFVLMFCAGIYFMVNVKVGLNQEMAMPTDSYMLDYFAFLYKYFEVGVPTYFVTKGKYNFSALEGMEGVCSSVGCNNNSMTQIIQYATQFPESSYLAIPASSWVDDFIDWLNPSSRCCRLYSFGPNADKFCPATSKEFACSKKCMTSNSNGIIRPSAEEFYTYLPLFLSDRPTLECSKGGLGAYDSSVTFQNESVGATRFMAYHTPLSNSQEFTAALKAVRELTDYITKTMRMMPGTDPDFEVFAYTITYVYYEQYLTIVEEGLFNIGLCLIPTFVVCCILLGMDLRSGLLNLLTIIMIVVDTVGVMTLWDIDYNAVALINLVTAVGISVEFVSHMTRSFALSIKDNKVERAKEATANMGSAVFAGVAMTNLPGIIVLAFAKAQLIQVFFFRMNLIITLLGVAHGLIFLPVLLSYCGPNINKAVLLELQKEKKNKMELGISNKGFEDNTAKKTMEDIYENIADETTDKESQRTTAKI